MNATGREHYGEYSKLDVDWERTLAQIGEGGFALLTGALAKERCEALVASYADDD